jgi:hypothetical protein
VVIWVLIGRQFTLAGFVGGLVLIVVMTVLLRRFVSRWLEQQARRTPWVRSGGARTIWSPSVRRLGGGAVLRVFELVGRLRGGAAVVRVVAVAAGLACAVAAWSGAAGAAGISGCATSRLVVWLDTQGNGAAGSSYYMLKLTNFSGHTCTLTGYPGVSAVDVLGGQLGSAASRDTVHSARRITLRNQATATVTVRIVDAANYPNSRCHHVMAAGLRVYPPNQKVSKVVPFPFQACSRRGPVYLSVETVQ